jgi:hypothetical protein
MSANDSIRRNFMLRRIESRSSPMPPGPHRFVATLALPPREVERRINAQALLGGTQYQVWGWARFGRVRLHRSRVSSSRGEFGLGGRIEPAGEGSRLLLEHRRSPLGCVFTALFYLPLLLITLALSSVIFVPGVGLGSKILFVLILAAIWLFPLLSMWLAGRGSERDLKILLDYLEGGLGATIVPEAEGETSQ